MLILWFIRVVLINQRTTERNNRYWPIHSTKVLTGRICTTYNTAPLVPWCESYFTRPQKSLSGTQHLIKGQRLFPKARLFFLLISSSLSSHHSVRKIFINEVLLHLPHATRLQDIVLYCIIFCDSDLIIVLTHLHYTFKRPVSVTTAQRLMASAAPAQKVAAAAQRGNQIHENSSTEWLFQVWFSFSSLILCLVCVRLVQNEVNHIDVRKW